MGTCCHRELRSSATCNSSPSICILNLLASLGICKQLLSAADIDYESSYGKARPNDTILKLQRTSPYYKRNRAHVCSFYVRGECTRGAECTYRHEMPETGSYPSRTSKIVTMDGYHPGSSWDINDY